LLFSNKIDCIHFLFSYSFTKFRLERGKVGDEGDKCPYDGVYVYEESDIKNNTQDLNVFCGNLDNELPEIKSKTNTMYVQFISDSSRNDEGFVGEILFVYGEYLYKYAYINFTYCFSTHIFKKK